MNVQQAYNAWSKSYDTVENKTRDLEAKALRECIVTTQKVDILELGCGTGKNTEYLVTVAGHLIGADFSTEMLAQAKAKISAPNVEFRQMDLREDWNFAPDSFDLVTCSLALEHIEHLDHVFGQVRRILRAGGRFYLGELHPFKQYQGGKARFETGNGVFELECFVHHVSEFFAAGAGFGLRVADLREWFDDDALSGVPRLLTMIFEKP